jgi:hypothetical protein
MEKFNIYISEIKTLKAKSIGRFIDFNHYSDIQCGYPAELENLQMNALSDFRMLSDRKIQCHLTLLLQLEELFSHFDQNYPELFMSAQNGTLLRNELFEYLSQIFDDIRLDIDATSVHSVMGIYAIILTKQNSILGLKNKTEDLLLERSLSQLKMKTPPTEM